MAREPSQERKKMAALKQPRSPYAELSTWALRPIPRYFLDESTGLFSASLARRLRASSRSLCVYSMCRWRASSSSAEVMFCGGFSIIKSPCYQLLFTNDLSQFWPYLLPTSEPIPKAQQVVAILLAKEVKRSFFLCLLVRCPRRQRSQFCR